MLERDQILVILPEKLREQLRLVEGQLDPAAFTGLGGDRLAAHAVLSGNRDGWSGE